MTQWVLILTGVVAVGIAAVIFAQSRETSKAEQMAAVLTEGVAQAATDTVDFAVLSDLPPPVARYFRHVLTEGQRVIKVVELRQSGVLRTDPATESWLRFTANQLVVPPSSGFMWNAKVELPLAMHVRVLDSYIEGVGSGRVSLLSAYAVAEEAGVPELNSGALHRYLAEAVWFPTALLPQSGVVWSPIDDYSALATLTDSGTTVSLEFRFNEIGEVTAIYSAGRYGQFDGEYRQVPWQGHFKNYGAQAGMRVPGYGEVGWYKDGALQLVWKGDLLHAQYEF